MININRNLSPAERARLENTEAEAARQAAITDYNVMMGNIEDPTAEEEAE